MQQFDRRRFLGACAAVSVTGAVGCGDTTEVNLPVAAPIAKVLIGAQSWGTSLVTSKILEILLREQLGEASAAIVSIPESRIWDALSKGEVHIATELWTLRNGNAGRAAISSGKVVEVGQTTVGRTAFYVPNYVDLDAITPISKFPELLAKIEPPITELLAGPNVEWLTPSPKRLEALSLSGLTVQNLPQEKALVEQITTLYDSEKPFLLALWQPHPLHARFLLKPVKLPDAAGCDANQEANACDLPAERVVRAITPSLRFSNPATVALVELFAPPTDDILSLIAGSGGSVPTGKEEALARQWIDSRKVIWQPWIDSAKKKGAAK